MSRLKRTSSGHLAKSAGGHLVKSCASITCHTHIGAGEGTAALPRFKCCYSPNSTLRVTWANAPDLPAIAGGTPSCTLATTFPAAGEAVLSLVQLDSDLAIWRNGCVAECDIYDATDGVTYTVALGIEVCRHEASGPAGWLYIYASLWIRRAVYDDSTPTIEWPCTTWTASGGAPGGSDDWWSLAEIETDYANTVDCCGFDLSPVMPHGTMTITASVENNACCNGQPWTNLGSEGDPDWYWSGTDCSAGTGACTSGETDGVHWTTNLCDEGI